MKGLILKELWLSKKLRIIGILLYLLMLIFAVLVKLSLLYGNLGHLNEWAQNNAADLTSTIMIFGFPILLYSSQFSCQIASDEKCRFRLLEHTMPVTERQIVSSVYIMNLISLAAMTVMSFANYGLTCAMFDREFKPMYLIYILAIGGGIFTLTHGRYTLFYRFRNEKKANTIFTAICMAIYFGVDGGFFLWINSYVDSKGFSFGSDDLPEGIMEGFWKEEVQPAVNWLGDNGWWLITVLIIGFAGLFWYLSVRALKRRGN